MEGGLNLKPCRDVNERIACEWKRVRAWPWKDFSGHGLSLDISHTLSSKGLQKWLPAHKDTQRPTAINALLPAAHAPRRKVAALALMGLFGAPASSAHFSDMQPRGRQRWSRSWRAVYVRINNPVFFWAASAMLSRSDSMMSGGGRRGSRCRVPPGWLLMRLCGRPRRTRTHGRRTLTTA